MKKDPEMETKKKEIAQLLETRLGKSVYLVCRKNEYFVKGIPSRFAGNMSSPDNFSSFNKSKKFLSSDLIVFIEFDSKTRDFVKGVAVLHSDIEKFPHSNDRVILSEVFSDSLKYPFAIVVSSGSLDDFITTVEKTFL